MKSAALTWGCCSLVVSCLEVLLGAASPRRMEWTTGWRDIMDTRSEPGSTDPIQQQAIINCSSNSLNTHNCIDWNLQKHTLTALINPPVVDFFAFTRLYKNHQPLRPPRLRKTQSRVRKTLPLTLWRHHHYYNYSVFNKETNYSPKWEILKPQQFIRDSHCQRVCFFPPGLRAENKHVIRPPHLVAFTLTSGRERERENEASTHTTWLSASCALVSIRSPGV